METVLKVLYLNISFPSIHYYIIDCPLPRSCKDWYDLGIRKNCHYPIYPDVYTQHLVTTLYNSTNNIYSNLLQLNNMFTYHIIRSTVI